jgi:hypothetical protein
MNDNPKVFAEFNDVASFESYYNSENFIFKYPYILDDNIFEQQALHYLPVDSGVEVECNLLTNSNVFDTIDGLKENRSSTSELRFRIAPGLPGMKALYNICKLMKSNCALTDSGIHFHIDFTDHFNIINDSIFFSKIKDFILNELDSWDYKGSYNARDVKIDYRCWVRFSSRYKTIEIRICEMSFDYEVLIKRLIHCHYIRKNILLAYNKYIKNSYEELINSNAQNDFDDDKIYANMHNLLNNNFINVNLN